MTRLRLHGPKLQAQVHDDRHPETAIMLDRRIAQWLDVGTREDTTRDRYEHLIRIFIHPTLGVVAMLKLAGDSTRRPLPPMARDRRVEASR